MWMCLEATVQWNKWKCSSRLHSRTRLHLFSSATYHFIHPGKMSKSNWVHKRLDESFIHSSTPYNVSPVDDSFKRLFYLSLFSFPIRRPRWRDGSQCQIRDDVSPFSWASPAGASHPETERGPGKGKAGGFVRFNSVFSHAHLSLRTFTIWPR